jgi:hypothetical protein
MWAAVPNRWHGQIGLAAEWTRLLHTCPKADLEQRVPKISRAATSPVDIDHSATQIPHQPGEGHPRRSPSRPSLHSMPAHKGNRRPTRSQDGITKTDPRCNHYPWSHRQHENRRSVEYLIQITPAFARRHQRGLPKTVEQSRRLRRETSANKVAHR